jgi:hypothetical protein
VPDSILNYHRFLFQWHCRHFFRFRAHLTRAEMDYLETCFGLARDFDEVSEFGFERFSYYTYSHRVDGDQVNSSRLAYGSVQRPAPALQAARPVLAHRAVALPDFFLENPHSHFYGLGWDFIEEQFKVYFRVTRLGELPPAERALITGVSLDQHFPEGLVSFTYTRNELSESKVYVYPRQGAAARMRTDRRGEVTQVDVAQSHEEWRERLSEPGRRILQLYSERNETLDTIAFQDREHYTLYFP